MSRRKIEDMTVNRTEGVVAALDYLGLNEDKTPVVGRTGHAIPKRKADRLKSLIAAVRLRFSI